MKPRAGTKHAVVVVADDRYWPRALITLRDVRAAGAWKGDLVLITIPPFQFERDATLQELGVELITFSHHQRKV